MTAAFDVVEVRRFEGHGNLKALAKVKIGCTVIHSCRIVQRPGHRSLGCPVSAAGAPEGGRLRVGWFPLIEITNRAILDQLRAAVLDAWEAHRTASHDRRDLPTKGHQTHQATAEKAAEVAPRIFGSKQDRDAQIQELAERFQPDEGDPFS